MNPYTEKEGDWWDELCEAHGAKNYWSKNKRKKEQKKSDEKKVSKG